MSIPVNRAVKTRVNVPAVAALAPAQAPTAVPSKTARAPASQAPAKSMRQMNKENEDLQAQVDVLSNSLQVAQAGKQAIKASYEKAAKEKDEMINKLQSDLDIVQSDAERHLSDTNAALQRATEEAREKAAHAEEAETALQKINARVKEYQACLESVGVDGVLLLEWTQRDAGTDSVGLAAVDALTEKQQDVVMLEEQIQKAMNDLRNTRKALEEDVEREQGFASTIARLRAQLTRTKEEAADHEAASDAGDGASDADDTSSEAGEETCVAADVANVAADVADVAADEHEAVEATESTKEVMASTTEAEHVQTGETAVGGGEEEAALLLAREEEEEEGQGETQTVFADVEEGGADEKNQSDTLTGEEDKAGAEHDEAELAGEENAQAALGAQDEQEATEDVKEGQEEEEVVAEADGVPGGSDVEMQVLQADTTEELGGESLEHVQEEEQAGDRKRLSAVADLLNADLKAELEGPELARRSSFDKCTC